MVKRRLMENQNPKLWEKYKPSDCIDYLKSIKITDTATVIKYSDLFNKEWAKVEDVGDRFNKKVYQDMTSIVKYCEAFLYKIAKEDKISFELLIKISEKLLSHLSSNDIMYVIDFITVILKIAVVVTAPLTPLSMSLNILKILISTINIDDINTLIKWIKDFNDLCIKEAKKALVVVDKYCVDLRNLF